MTKETETNQSESTELDTLRKHVADLTKDIKSIKAERDRLASEKEEVETEAASAAGDIEKLKQQLEAKHKKEVDGLKSQIEQLGGDLRSIRVDAEINQTIAALGIIPAHVPAVEALMHRKVQYEDGTASIDGKSISDWAKAWSAKDGAIYRPAPDNSGANVSSNDGTTSSQFAIPKSAADVTPELMKLSVTDSVQYNSIMDQANLPHLKV